MANGDITLTTPKSIPNVVFGDFFVAQLPSPLVTFTFFETDATGPAHIVRITNSSVIGFDVVGSVITDNQVRALSGYLTTILGVLFIGNATTLNQRKTATVSRLVADGVIVVTGTVG